jgi:hypothetical protein
MLLKIPKDMLEYLSPETLQYLRSVWIEEVENRSTAALGVGVIGGAGNIPQMFSPYDDIDMARAFLEGHPVFITETKFKELREDPHYWYNYANLHKNNVLYLSLGDKFPEQMVFHPSIYPIILNGIKSEIMGRFKYGFIQFRSMEHLVHELVSYISASRSTLLVKKLYEQALQDPEVLDFLKNEWREFLLKNKDKLYGFTNDRFLNLWERCPFEDVKNDPVILESVNKARAHYEDERRQYQEDFGMRNKTKEIEKTEASSKWNTYFTTSIVR